jgi:penicillin amidase
VPRIPSSRRTIALVALVAALVATLAPARAASEITIVRDGFGVPHVYGATGPDVSYGAGYALAQDRLWQMHTFRRVAKGRLSELLGIVDILGVADTVSIDKDVRFYTYTAEERARKFETYPEEIRANLQAFADGINARIAEVQLDPTQLPLEFVEFADPIIEPWTVDDSIALSDVLILSFGAGGGNEVRHAALLKELIARHGEELGTKMFDDLIVTEDPDGPITIPQDFDYANEPTFGDDAESESRRALNEDARISLTAGAASAGTASRAARGTAAQLALMPDPAKVLPAFERLANFQEALSFIFSFGSNAQITGPEHSESGNAVQTAGPQVGYLLPQWLADIGLHAADGSLDAMGMTFAGAGPAVLIGRGNGFAWTTTTGSSDLSDTFVEKLNPENNRQYLYNGVYEDMECRTEEYAFRGLIPIDEQEICRTRHGPVVAFDEANGVAYAQRYSWFNREAQTVEGFFSYNRVRNVSDFATFANFLGSNHNMFYVDDQGHYGYWHPGNHPVRAEGIDIRLPQDGTGGSEWQGLVPVQDVPHAVDFPRGWLANWNNQPALGWKRERGWNAIDNAADLYRTLDPALSAVADPLSPQSLVNEDRMLDFEDLSGNLRYAAFKDHNDTYFRPFVPEDADLNGFTEKVTAAALRAWDGFRTDQDDDGMWDSPGPTILTEWISVMIRNAFADELGFLGDMDDWDDWANANLVWHLLTTEDTLDPTFDWLNGTEPVDFAVETFAAAVANLSTRFQNAEPGTWREPARLEHYQRLNADLVADTLFGELGLDNSGDSGLPGDVADLIKMDRGTYNHVVVYTDQPAGGDVLGLSGSEHGSVIPPGQSGFVSLLLQEDPHYEDQLALYLEWRYKPMWLSIEEARADAESEIKLSR